MATVTIDYHSPRAVILAIVIQLFQGSTGLGKYEKGRIFNVKLEDVIYSTFLEKRDHEEEKGDIPIQSFQPMARLPRDPV